MSDTVDDFDTGLTTSSEESWSGSEEESSCVICMNQIQERATIKSCSHSFCRTCILKWAETNRICPLCKSSFTVLLVPNENENKNKSKSESETTHKNFRSKNADGMKEVFVDAPTVKPQINLQEDLQCLDHTYFHSESKKLLSTATATKQKLALAFHNSKSTSYKEEHWEALEGIIDTLNDLIYFFADEYAESFDPYEMLQQLYELEQNLDLVVKAKPVSLPTKQAPLRFSADDIDYDDYYDEDEEDDTDFHVTVTVKPNNASATRSPAKGEAKVRVVTKGKVKPNTRQPKKHLK